MKLYAAVRRSLSRACASAIFSAVAVLCAAGAGHAQIAGNSGASDPRPISIVPALSHWGSASVLAVSPDGKWIVSGTDTIKLWEFSTGRLVRDFEGHPGGLGGTALAFDPSSRYLISTGNGDPIKVWDIATGHRLPFMKDNSTKAIRADWLSVSPDGRRVAYSDFEATKIRDMQTGAMLRTFDSTGPVAFFPDGDRIAVTQKDGMVAVLNLGSGQKLLTIEGHTRSQNNFGPHREIARGLTNLAVSPNGQIIATSSEDRTAKLWDATNGRLLRTIQAHTDEVKWVAFAADSRSVVTRGPAKEPVKIWDIATGRLLRSIAANASSTALSRDARFLVTGDKRGISVWSFETGNLLQEILSRNNLMASVDASLGTKILSAGWDGKVRLWDLQEARLVRSIAAHERRAEAVAVSPDGRFVVSGDSENLDTSAQKKKPALKVWDIASGRLVRSMTGQDADVGAIVFSPDGKQLLTSGLGKPALFDFSSGKLLHQFDAFARAVFYPNGQTILSGQYVANTVSTFDPKSGRRTGDLGRNVTAKYFAVTPDGSRLFGAHNSNIIEFEGRNPPRLFSRHEDPTLMGVMDIAISKSGNWLATGAWNGTLKLWDLKSGSSPSTVQAHPVAIRSLSFAKDESLLATSSQDGTIRLWNPKRLGAPIATLIASGTNEWVIMTPEGFFAGSPNASSILSVVRGLDVTTTEQVHQSLFNPDLVREALAGDPNGEYRRAVAANNLAKVLDSGPAPLVQIVSPATNSQTATDTAAVVARITDRGKGIGRIEWRVNGITASVESDRSVPGTEYSSSRTLALDPGDNIVEVIAYNAANLLASTPARIKLTLTAAPDMVKPKLHVLAIGINAYVDKGSIAPGSTEQKLFPPLKLAVTDAASIAGAFQKASASQYSDVRVTQLSDTDATLAGIDAAVTLIAGEIHPRDTFVLFSAAHGFSLNGRFYLIPQDYQGGPDPAALEKNAIGQAQLQDWIANRIKARKAVILFDTCESGALVSGATNSRTDTPASQASIGRLHEATGRPILTAAASGKPAFEGYRGHGVFTYAVLDALRNGDTSGNGRIELSELVAHVQRLVPKLSAELSGTGRASVAVRGASGETQSARFGSRGEDFALVPRLR